MDFISPLFLFLFLPVFLLFYLISRQSVRLPLILAASVVFLSAGQLTAIWWLGGILIAGYLLGHAISWGKNSSDGNLWLMVGIGINLFILACFKLMLAYGPIGLAWVYIPEALAAPISSLAVPLGLSYVTFQMISYLVDIARGGVQAEKNFVRLAIYILFFPKIVSGPLVRYKPFSELLDQITPSIDKIIAGFRRLMIGFIKRTLIANQLALVVNAAFNLPTPNFGPGFAWLALIAYTLQLFFDFAGYTDMAIGLGLMVGMRLPENFNYPYIAQSISDFWRRWHMTLTGWFREYVFYPLERHRFQRAGQQINIVLVFLLTGLWHGFNPTFIVWGLMHGIMLALESAGFGRWLKNLWQPLRHLYTLAIISAGWVIFRSSSLAFAFGFFRRLAGNSSGLTPLPFSQTAPLPFIEPSFILALIAGVFFCLPLSDVWQRFRAGFEARKPMLFFAFQPLEDVLLVTLFILGLAALLSGTFAPNIYAKF